MFAGFLNPAEVQQPPAPRHKSTCSPAGGEALPISLLEARAAGLPIVAMAGGGVSEVIEAGPHGFITPTHREFVDAMVRVIGDVDLQRVIEIKTMVGLEQFSWDIMVNRHMDIYRQAIAARDVDGMGTGDDAFAHVKRIPAGMGTMGKRKERSHDGNGHNGSGGHGQEREWPQRRLVPMIVCVRSTWSRTARRT